DNDVTDVDADAEFDSPFIRQLHVPLSHRSLDFDGAPHGVDGACKFNQCAITGGLKDTTAVLANLWIKERMAEALDCGEGSFLVAAHQPVVTHPIRCENGSYPPLRPLAGHLGSLGYSLSAGVYGWLSRASIE